MLIKRLISSNYCPSTAGKFLLPNDNIVYSAGVGRTGTYISLETLLKQAKAKGFVDAYTCVSEMRERRPCMIQTLVNMLLISTH